MSVSPKTTSPVEKPLVSPQQSPKEISKEDQKVNEQKKVIQPSTGCNFTKTLEYGAFGAALGAGAVLTASKLGVGEASQKMMTVAAAAGLVVGAVLAPK